ncbi:MAG: chemotaxis protein CheW [Deltaproteobacteria bacterium]|nr:chemotaxis protein CheW [Deltaproteobacteria bacterium]
MSAAVITEATQYLTFTLDEEDFALEISKVKEILDFTTITKVPRMPEFFRGVLNLRGNVVPVIDLRLKLGMKAIERTVDTCIVIIEISIDGELTLMGALADSVKEVIDLDPGQISPPPTLGTRLDTRFLKGMGKCGEKFLIILDIDMVLSSDELALVKNSADSSNTSSPPAASIAASDAGTGREVDAV